MKHNTSRKLAAGRFKAECLALLDDVARTKQPLTITKRGKPVARLVPVDEPEVRSLRGSVTYEGDIISPIDEEWDAQQ